LSAAVSAVAIDFERHKKDRHCTAPIVRVPLRAALFDRPIRRACDPRNWKPAARPPVLPGQSTMSRRTRREDFMSFPERMGVRLGGKPRRTSVGVPTLVKVVDGKPLELPNHTTDRDATWGRGVSRTSVGYKLHAIFSGNPMPDAFVVTTLNVSEKAMTRRTAGRLTGTGCLPADGLYDSSGLYDYCHHHNHQPVCPRSEPGADKRGHYVSVHRKRGIDLPEIPEAVSSFGRTPYDRRTNIERDFSQLTCFGGGLAALPPWVRRIWRVRNWVTSKLLINAARIRINRKMKVGA